MIGQRQLVYFNGKKKIFFLENIVRHILWILKWLDNIFHFLLSHAWVNKCGFYDVRNTFWTKKFLDSKTLKRYSHSRAFRGSEKDWYWVDQLLSPEDRGELKRNGRTEMVRWLIDLLKEIDDVPRPRGGKEENLKQLSRDREALGVPTRRGPGGEAGLRRGRGRVGRGG